MASTIINQFGQMVGWNDITVNLLGRDLEGITEIEYGDESEMNNEYGAGEYPIGRSKGNYSATASITVYEEELKALEKSLPIVGGRRQRMQEIPAFDIAVTYEYGDNIITDVIRNCKFKNTGKVGKQNEGKMTKKLDLLTSHIEYNK